VVEDAPEQYAELLVGFLTQARQDTAR
jgi:hypothetical protein